MQTQANIPPPSSKFHSPKKENNKVNQQIYQQIHKPKNVEHARAEYNTNAKEAIQQQHNGSGRQWE